MPEISTSHLTEEFKDEVVCSVYVVIQQMIAQDLTEDSIRSILFSASNAMSESNETVVAEIDIICPVSLEQGSDATAQINIIASTAPSDHDGTISPQDLDAAMQLNTPQVMEKLKMAFSAATDGDVEAVKLLMDNPDIAYVNIVKTYLLAVACKIAQNS